MKKVKIDFIVGNYRKNAREVSCVGNWDVTVAVNDSWIDEFGYVKRFVVKTMIEPMLQQMATLAGFDSFKIVLLSLVKDEVE